MPDFLKICELLINSSMRFVKNEFLTPQLSGFFGVLKSAFSPKFRKSENTVTTVVFDDWRLKITMVSNKSLLSSSEFKNTNNDHFRQHRNCLSK